MKVNLNKKGQSSKNWIQDAVNPKHKGYCTPMTKSTCTPKRKAFAETMKKNHGFHKDGTKLIPKAQNGINIQKQDAIPVITIPKQSIKITDDFYNKPISERSDFNGNIFSYQASGATRRDAHGTLGDLYRYYGGDKLKYNILYHSKYKPLLSKNKSQDYIAIKDPNFINEVLESANRLFVDKKLNINKSDYSDKIINDHTYSISGYGDKKLSSAIGRYFISKGSDENGEYISYYDTFDTNQPNNGPSLSEKLNLTKPFEIYDRIYVKKDKNKKFMQIKKQGGSIEFVNDLIDKFQKGGKKTLVTLPKTKPDIETNSTGVTDNHGYHFQENKTLTFPNNGLPLIQRILQTTPYINREINRYPTQQADTIYSGVGLNGQNFNYSSKGNTPEFRSVNGLFNRSVETKGEGGEINKDLKQVEVVAKRPTTNYFYKSPADSIEYIGSNGTVKTNTLDFINNNRESYNNSLNSGLSKQQAIDKLYHDKNVIRLGIESKKYPSQVFDMNMVPVDKTKLNPRRTFTTIPLIP